MVSRGIPNQPLHHVTLQLCLYLSGSVLRVPKPLCLYVVVEKCYKISWESISSPIQLRAREAESFQKARTSELLHLLPRDFFVVKFFHLNRIRSRKSSDFEKLLMGSFGNSGSLYPDRIHQQKVWEFCLLWQVVNVAPHVRNIEIILMSTTRSVVPLAMFGK